MDIRNRVMGDKPDSFLHKIAGIVPGFNGYMERERRRDADKLLRTHLAGQYSNIRARLTRVQQGMVRGKNLDYIAEVDRVAGVLQRFIDRLSTATYGYTGLFDPVKIEEQDLDMLYAFDMSIASGIEQVDSAVSALESATGGTEGDEVSPALLRLSGVVDDLNLRLNQRQDFISTGQGLPQDQYNSMLTSLNPAPAYPAAPSNPMPPTSTPEQPGGAAQSSAPYPYVAPSGGMGSEVTPSTGAPTMPTGSMPSGTEGGQMARVQSGDTNAGDMSSSYDMGSLGDRPETPRASSGTSGASGTEMGRLDEMPPIDEWPSAPSPWTDKPSSTGGSEGTMGDSESGSGLGSGPSMPPASSGRAGLPGDMGNTGSETAPGSDYPRSSQADSFGMGSGSAGGAYGSSTGGTGGIESGSAPSMPGEDLADNPVLANDTQQLDTQAGDNNYKQEDKG